MFILIIHNASARRNIGPRRCPAWRIRAYTRVDEVKKYESSFILDTWRYENLNADNDSLFRLITKKTSKLHTTVSLWGDTTHRWRWRTVMRKTFPRHDVSCSSRLSVSDIRLPYWVGWGYLTNLLHSLVFSDFGCENSAYIGKLDFAAVIPVKYERKSQGQIDRCKIRNISDRKIMNEV